MGFNILVVILIVSFPVFNCLNECGNGINLCDTTVMMPWTKCFSPCEGSAMKYIIRCCGSMGKQQCYQACNLTDDDLILRRPCAARCDGGVRNQNGICNCYPGYYGNCCDSPSTRLSLSRVVTATILTYTSEKLTSSQTVTTTRIPTRNTVTYSFSTTEVHTTATSIQSKTQSTVPSETLKSKVALKENITIQKEWTIVCLVLSGALLSTVVVVFGVCWIYCGWRPKLKCTMICKEKIGTDITTTSP